MPIIDTLIENAHEVFTASEQGVLHGHAIGIVGEDIAFIGPLGELESAGFHITEATQHHSAEGQLITPGLIDPHTHIVFGGDRSHEYAMRAAGAGYRD